MTSPDAPRPPVTPLDLLWIAMWEDLRHNATGQPSGLEIIARYRPQIEGAARSASPDAPRPDCKCKAAQYNGYHLSNCPAARSSSDLIDAMAYFLFQLGYPFDTTVRDSDGDPVVPPLAVLDRLIEEWREHEVLPDTDETRENYRDAFAIEIGRDPWETSR